MSALDLRAACALIARALSDHPGFSARIRVEMLDMLCVLAINDHAPSDPETGMPDEAAATRLLLEFRDDVRRMVEIDQRVQREWLAKLTRAWSIWVPSRSPRFFPGPGPTILLQLDGWDLHELYTRLVDPSGKPEGCCAGCTRLPEGWCATCDAQREDDA